MHEARAVTTRWHHSRHPQLQLRQRAGEEVRHGSSGWSAPPHFYSCLLGRSALTFRYAGIMPFGQQYHFTKLLQQKNYFHDGVQLNWKYS